jgi:hypothetical protein
MRTFFEQNNTLYFIDNEIINEIPKGREKRARSLLKSGHISRLYFLIDKDKGLEIEIEKRFKKYPKLRKYLSTVFIENKHYVSKININFLINFIDKYEKNKNPKIDNLLNFVFGNSLDIQKNGNFVGFKAVKKDYYDIFSGTIKYDIGKTISIKKYDTEDDCGGGLHFGSYSYVKEHYEYNFCRLLRVEIDPRDVLVSTLENKAKAKKLKVLEEIQWQE